MGIWIAGSPHHRCNQDGSHSKWKRSSQWRESIACKIDGFVRDRPCQVKTSNGIRIQLVFSGKASPSSSWSFPKRGTPLNGYLEDPGGTPNLSVYSGPLASRLRICCITCIYTEQLAQKPSRALLISSLHLMICCCWLNRHMGSSLTPVSHGGWGAPTSSGVSASGSAPHRWCPTRHPRSDFSGAHGRSTATNNQ